MKIAITHDDFMQYGGAEKLVTAMLEAFPEADIYTSLYDRKLLERLEIPERRVEASFMQKLPFKKLFYKKWFFLYPLAFETLSSAGQLDQYDVVISSTARFAHGVLTKPQTIHIAYVNSPGRMWWEPEKYFSKGWQRKLFLPFQKWLRFWDKAAMARVDYVIANSENVANKIEQVYGRKADKVVYPFVDGIASSLSPFAPRNDVKGGAMKGFVPLVLCHCEDPDGHRGTKQSREILRRFLVVTRLVPWKRVDIAVSVFRENPQLGSLVVVGRGPDRRRLKKLATGAKSVSFLSGLTDSELSSYYESCRALIVTQEEDFGIAPLEAMAHGKPVVAYRKGGVLETVQEGKHGVFFDRQDAASLKGAIEKLDPSEFDEKVLKKRARGFSKERFQKEVRDFLLNVKVQNPKFKKSSNIK